MAKITLNETGRNWLKKHGACDQGYRWACENCATLDDVWATAKPEWLIWVATRQGCLDDKTLRLFAVWSARQVQRLMKDPRLVAALDVAERFANGDATKDELVAARAAARDAACAARDAACAARDAAMAAACAARDAAWDAARDAAWDAARAAFDAARAAAWDAACAARDAACAAARDAQAAKLREMATPNWS